MSTARTIKCANFWDALVLRSLIEEQGVQVRQPDEVAPLSMVASGDLDRIKATVAQLGNKFPRSGPILIEGKPGDDRTPEPPSEPKPPEPIRPAERFARSKPVSESEPARAPEPAQALEPAQGGSRGLFEASVPYMLGVHQWPTGGQDGPGAPLHLQLAPLRRPRNQLRHQNRPRPQNRNRNRNRMKAWSSPSLFPRPSRPAKPHLPHRPPHLN